MKRFFRDCLGLNSENTVGEADSANTSSPSDALLPKSPATSSILSLPERFTFGFETKQQQLEQIKDENSTHGFGFDSN